MKATEKAKELVNRFRSIKDSQSSDGGNLMFKNEAKQCALICVDEKQKTIDKMFNGYYTMSEKWKKEYDELEEVKQEIEKL